MTGALDIETSARLAGGHRWIEQRLFEMLGRWSQEVAVTAAKPLLGAQSLRHAWHAELWQGCLPALPHLDPDELTAAPSPALAALVEDVADPAGRCDDLARLVGVYRVLLPWLDDAYAARAAVSSSVADAPVLRALELIGADRRRDRAGGERLVRSLVVGRDEARRAAERQAWLEGELSVVGGWPGHRP